MCFGRNESPKRREASGTQVSRPRPSGRIAEPVWGREAASGTDVLPPPASSWSVAGVLAGFTQTDRILSRFCSDTRSRHGRPIGCFPCTDVLESQGVMTSSQGTHKGCFTRSSDLLALLAIARGVALLRVLARASGEEFG